MYQKKRLKRRYQLKTKNAIATEEFDWNKNIGWRRGVLFEEEELNWKGWFVYWKMFRFERKGGWWKSLVKIEAFYLKRRAQFKRKRVWLEKGGVEFSKQIFCLNNYDKISYIKEIKKNSFQNRKRYDCINSFWVKEKLQCHWNEYFLQMGFCKSKQKSEENFWKEEWDIWSESVEKNCLNRKGTDLIEKKFD